MKTAEQRAVDVVKQFCELQEMDPVKRTGDPAQMACLKRHITTAVTEALQEQVIPLLLHCPLCHERHVDKGEFEKKPHHTHACQSCGHVWRPAVEATVGVQFLPGFKDKEELP